MSTQTTKRGSDSRRRLVTFGVIIAVILLAMAIDTKVVPMADITSNVFSPEAYGKKEFPRIHAEIVKASVDAKELAKALAEDQTAAGEKYGKPGSVGPIFAIKFSGLVQEGENGIFAVKVDGLPEAIGIRVQTGPAINGTEVRDATGTVTFGQFTNQIEYQDAGAA